VGKNREVETRAAPAILAHRRRRSKEKAPGGPPSGGEVLRTAGGKENPRRAVILARRWHGRDGERPTEAAPSMSAHGLVSAFGTNNWPARAIISCRSLDVRCWQMRTFQLIR
jgi:hypothetical protein